MPHTTEYLLTPEQAGVPLQPGESYTFRPTVPYGDQAAVAAEIYTDAEGKTDSRDPADRLMLIDMRSAPIEKDGYRRFDDVRVVGEASYLLIDPTNFDPHNGVGYKALRPGESFLFGRPSADLPQTDKRWRFTGLSKATSRSHFEISVSEDERVAVVDVGSTNGTHVIAETTPEAPAVRQSAIPAQKIGSLALAEQLNTKPEIQVGEFHFGLVGRIPTRRRGDLYVVSSRDDVQGHQRRFMVYRSQSEGGLRASQGIEADGRFMKGSEDLESHQYTQDTQLHPDFAAALEQLVRDDAAGTPLQESDILLDHSGVERASKDFENEVEVYTFRSQQLAELVHKTRAGNLSTVDIEFDFGDTNGFISYINELNAAILSADILPDFSSKPVSTHQGDHPLLGHITTEVYAKDGIEWHMATDPKGRVWIDRLRLQNATPTAYGTDKQMIYSGILTSKPLDYQGQTSGLPSGMRRKFDERYDDITPFLAQLAPVREYSKTRAQQH